MMDSALRSEQVLALGIFAAYFSIIFCLAYLVFSSIRIQAARSADSDATKTSGRRQLFSVLTLGSLIHTWYYMFKFMFWSFADYEGASLIDVPRHVTHSLLQRVADWLVDTALFEQAWWLVSTDGMNWWWSEQLCLFTVGAWTIFLYEYGSRYNIKHLWAYTLLGQLVAISVASNLFYLAILCSPSSPSKQPTKKTIAMSPLIYLSVLLSLATVAISPHTDKTTFLPNLLVMHVFITVPLFFPQPPSRAPSKWSLSPSTAYFLVFLFSIPIRSRTVLSTLSSIATKSAYEGTFAFIQQAWETLHWHPAQSSIGWDVVWTTASFIVWAAVTDPNSGLAGATYDAKRRSRMWTVPYLLVAAPFASVGVTAPYVLRPLPRDDGEERDGKEE